MNSGRLFIVVTLVVALGLGAFASVAIVRKAHQRAVLSDEMATRLPPVERTRVLTPWAPAADGDDAHATFCLDDDADAAAAVSRFLAALRGGGWTPGKVDPNPRTGAVRFQASGDGLRLRGIARTGTRPDCNSSRRQTVLAVEALRDRS